MRKPSKRTQRVREFLEKHPNAKPADVAKTFKTAVGYVYKLRSDMKLDKALTMSKPSAMFLNKSSPKAVAKDNVNHPAHYKTGGIETIDFIEAKSLNYNLGNVVKYITRAGVKDKTKHIEDLEKGAWYLAREIANLKKGK